SALSSWSWFTFAGVKPSPDRAREHAFVEARRRVQKLDDREIAARLDRAFSPAHWRRLVPELTVEAPDPPTSLDTPPLSQPPPAHASATLPRGGSSRLAPARDSAASAVPRRSVEALAAAGWPPVFAYVYDDLWEILRAPSLQRLLASALGAGYRHSPRVWAHF